MQENQEIDSQVENFVQKEDSLVEEKEIKNNSKRKWVSLAVVGIASSLLLGILSSFIFVDQCKTKCNCPNESICSKTCRSVLSIFNIKNCSYKIAPAEIPVFVPRIGEKDDEVNGAEKEPKDIVEREVRLEEYNNGYYSIKYPSNWEIATSVQMTTLANVSGELILNMNAFPSNNEVPNDDVEKLRSFIGQWRECLKEPGPCIEYKIVKKKEQWILEGITEITINNRTGLMYKYAKKDNTEISELYYIANEWWLYEIEVLYDVDLVGRELHDKVDGILDSFEYVKNVEVIEKNISENMAVGEIILHPECTDENPPRIYNYAKAERGLDLCGNKIESNAYEFEDEKFILFVDFDFGDYEDKVHTLSLISTEAPFEEIVLGTFIGFDGLMGSLSYSTDSENKINDIFFLWGSGDSPGDLKQIFIFEPRTKNYLLAENYANFGRRTISVFSSNSNYSVQYYTDFRIGGEDIVMDDEDISLVINDEKFTKKEVASGRGEEYLDVFDCRFLDILNHDEKRLKEYLKYFPDKVPCYKNSFSNVPEVIGFIDLENNEFYGNSVE